MKPTSVIDPVRFCKLAWPEVKLYDKEKEILYSVRDNDETMASAGNGLGKDFVSAICAIWWMCSRRPARCVTTSVQYDQLNDVLWGEIRKFIQSSQINLPLQYNHLKIRQVYDDGRHVPLSELVGQCVSKHEGLLGRHLPKTGTNGNLPSLPRTLCIFDEASGIDDSVYESTDTWAHRKLVIGNPYPCSNFFYRGVKQGDLKKPEGEAGLYRKVIKIKAEDSPNVKFAEAEIRAGRKPSGRILVPGVVDYDTYRKRRTLWDTVRQSIGLDAEFYEGSEVLLYPPDWLDAAERYYNTVRGKIKAEAIGVDPAEGGDNTCWCVIGREGIVHMLSLKTEDTAEIPRRTLQLMNQYGVAPDKVCFDRGGGGKQIADQLRQQGYPVKTVAFGQSIVPEKRSAQIVTLARRVDEEEVKYAYKNRRSQMYGRLRERLDPSFGLPFGIPSEYSDLRRQMSPIPLKFDGEGRLSLPPKRKNNPNSNEVCLVDIIGHSPDELDALVIAYHSLYHVPFKSKAGAA